MFVMPSCCLFPASFNFHCPISSLCHPSSSTDTVLHSADQQAGKTTLVNYILKEQNEWKIAVLENEFGEVSC